MQRLPRLRVRRLRMGMGLRQLLRFVGRLPLVLARIVRFY